MAGVSSLTRKATALVIIGIQNGRHAVMHLGDKGSAWSSANVFDAEKLVEINIKNCPLTRTDKAGKPLSLVGGKVAVATLTPNKSEWIERSGCGTK